MNLFTGTFLFSVFFSQFNPPVSAAPDYNAFTIFSDSTYSGPAGLSYRIGDRKVSIRSYLETGGKHIGAIYSNYVQHDEKNGMIIIQITNNLSTEVFTFNVKDKGETAISGYKPTLSNQFESGSPKASYMSGKYQNYYAAAVTVKIAMVDGKKVTGTFSGQFKSDNGETISITEGSFELPFTKTGS